MKMVMLASVLGIRLSERNDVKAKPMVENRGQRILLGNIDIYAAGVRLPKSVWQDDKAPRKVWD